MGIFFENATFYVVSISFRCPVDNFHHICAVNLTMVTRFHTYPRFRTRRPTSSRAVWRALGCLRHFHCCENSGTYLTTKMENILLKCRNVLILNNNPSRCSSIMLKFFSGHLRILMGTFSLHSYIYICFSKKINTEMLLQEKC